MKAEDTTNLIPRWAVTLVTVLLAVLAAIANVITMTVTSGSWLGLSDIQWHWVLLACAVIVALNAAINKAVLTEPPTNKRVKIASALHVERHRLEHDPQIT